MSDLEQPMESPSGLELHPDPPPTARISKKVGLAYSGSYCSLASLLWTLCSPGAAASCPAINEEKHRESARRVGDQLVKEWLRLRRQIQLQSFPGAPAVDPGQVTR